jgi:hypothetical protein
MPWIRESLDEIYPPVQAVTDQFHGADLLWEWVVLFTHREKTARWSRISILIHYLEEIGAHTLPESQGQVCVMTPRLPLVLKRMPDAEGRSIDIPATKSAVDALFRR